MSGQEDLVRNIESILLESDWPMTAEMLDKEIEKSQDRAKNGRPEKVYSPANQYWEDDRVFHPSPKMPGWFTVIEPVKDSCFTARFDNGALKQLGHNLPDQPFRYTDQNIRKERLLGIKETAGSYGQVVNIGKLYVHRQLHERVPFARLSQPRALPQLVNRRAKPPSSEQIKLLQKKCADHDFCALYYLAPLKNVCSILDRGILAKNLAPPDHASFADDEIQQRRDGIVPPNGLQLTLHDYVPLFFAPRPPLLFRHKQYQDRLVYLVINVAVLLEPGSLFSPANACSRDARFFSRLDCLDQLDWKVLSASSWYDDDTEEHGRKKRARQAEALIPVRIPIPMIQRIVVCSKGTQQQMQEIMDAHGLEIPVESNRSFYF